MNGNQVSLYYHIPFCTKKCDYCHFYVIPEHEQHKDQLLLGLDLEWKLRLPQLKGKQAISLYFGGGTPSLMEPKAIAHLIEQAAPLLTPDAEITIEANPENLTREKMKAFAQAGINRVSIGIQTLDPILLQTLSRTHNADQAKRAVHDTFDSGITNITIDLMYDVPGQTLNHWEKSLHEATSLPIQHLSLYNLVFEQHTVFYKKRDALTPLLPDPDTSARMYKMAVQHLTQHKLLPYEISAFAKEGYQSRHNIGYWTARPFLGFGPSAFSYWDYKRFRNAPSLSRYVRALANGLAPVDFEEQLDPASRFRELLTIGLRMRQGIHLPKFIEQYGPIEPQTETTIQSLIAKGLLTHEQNTLRLSEQGILFYDTVASDLV